MKKQKPEIKAVVLDMDGTMFNSEHIYNAVLESMLQKRGQTFTNDLKMRMMGLPGPEAFRVMKEDCDLSDSIESLSDEAHDIFFQLMPGMIQMMPGLIELLDHIQNAGLPKAIATSSTTRLTTAALETFDLVSRFEFFLTGDDVTNGKPDPEVYLTAAKRLNVQPAEMLVLEDSITGSRAAAASGAYTIAIPEPHSLGLDFSHVDQVVDRLDSPIIFELITAKI